MDKPADNDPEDDLGDAAGDERWIDVAGDRAGTRLDKLLADAWPDMSRSRLKSLIRSGSVAVTGLDPQARRVVDDPSSRVKPGEIYRLTVPDVAPAAPVAQAIPLDIAFEDDHIIVVDKPAGMVVHPAAGHADGTLVNALLAHCGASLSGIGGVRRPGIVHRIDKDTSGLLVVAKTDAAHARLAGQFASHTLERVYRAVVWGLPTPVAGRIEGNIGRDPGDRKRMRVLARGGKSARTDYAVTAVAPGGGAALLDCRLATGRTHQIRAHLTGRGHPLIGDPVYGRAGKARIALLARGISDTALDRTVSFRRQALHAAVLGFRHPVDGQSLRFDSPPPADMAGLIRCLFDAVVWSRS